MMCELHNKFVSIIYRMFFGNGYYNYTNCINLWAIVLDLIIILMFPIVVVFCIVYRIMKTAGEIEFYCSPPQR